MTATSPRGPTTPAPSIWRRPAGAPPASLLLALLALTTAAAYLALVLPPLRLDRHPPDRRFNLASSLGEDVPGLARFVLTMALLFGLYLAAVAAARRPGRGRAVVALAGGALIAVTLFPAHPFYSFDVFHYIASTRVLYEHGYNPLIVPPASITGDPLTLLPDWSSIPSPYGPVWNLLTAVPHYATGGSDSAIANLLAFKALSVAFALGAAWLAGAIAERLRPGSRPVAVVLFAWNPLIILHTAGDAHNDAVMVCLMLLAAYCAVRGWMVRAALALTLSALVKFASLLLLPLLLVWLLKSDRPHRRREAALVAAVVPLVAIAAYLPFWEGRETLAAAMEEGSYLTTSVAAVFAPALEWSMSRHTAEVMLTLGSRLLFLPAFALVLRRMRPTPSSLLSSAAIAYLLYLLIAAAWFMPWYVLWPLAFAAAMPFNGRAVTLIVALSFGALMLPVSTNYLSGMSDRGDAWPPMHVVAVLVVWSPVAVAAAWPRPRGSVGLIVRKKGAGGDSAAAGVWYSHSDGNGREATP